MAINLNAPMPTVLGANEQAVLAKLQGNILKGHGRRSTGHMFLSFDPAAKIAIRDFLRLKLGPKLTTAETQLINAAKFRKARKTGKKGPPTPPFIGLLISKTGYTALGVPNASIPSDAAFRAGLKVRGVALNDPAPATWDATYQPDVDAMLLIGGDPNATDANKSTMVDSAIAALTAAFPAGITVLGIERGRAQFNGNGDGIEHFGFVDGRSQPLLMQSDIDRERDTTDGTSVWDPAFPLKQVLVAELGGDPDAFGSYFVFRKLEQNVKDFKKAESDLGKKLLAANPHFDTALAGAMIVGRFRDGTPVTLQKAEGMHRPVPNNFDYASDMSGLRCPFHAHIRKSNPRGDTSRQFGAPLADERTRIMARRGITYGRRRQNTKKEFADKPSKNVGLLFMAYQSDIGRQFEFTQGTWVNNENFLLAGTGIDPVIGQGGALAQTHRAGWGDPAAKTKTFRFADFVTLKGGEYFFAPSLSFVTSL